MEGFFADPSTLGRLKVGIPRLYSFLTGDIPMSGREILLPFIDPSQAHCCHVRTMSVFRPCTVMYRVMHENSDHPNGHHVLVIKTSPIVVARAFNRCVERNYREDRFLKYTSELGTRVRAGENCGGEWEF